MKPVFYFVILFISVQFANAQKTTVFTHANIIDGTGRGIQLNQNIVVKDGLITSIEKFGKSYPTDFKIVDLQDKYIIPELINAHGHLGILKDTIMSASNYTAANIKHQLLRYQNYGVGKILSMGTEQPGVISIRDSSRAGQIPGATIYSALYGFGVKDGAPPLNMGMTNVYRPETAEQATKQVDSLAMLKPDMIKVWVDDFWKQFPKMKPEIYSSIIKEAHIKGIRVAAHIYYLEDAHKLVDLGLDVIAHSIRDKEVDIALLQKMKKKGVTYIPTLSLDEFAFIYEQNPEWMNDPFFKASLEPGVFEMITSAAYKAKIARDPKMPMEKLALQIAMKNLLKIYEAGIPVLMGTDSGAQPIRAQGFSEHMEMELFVIAGISPIEAIRSATQKGAVLLKIDSVEGTIQRGKKASFIVLDKNPLANIKHTRSIKSVYKNGIEVSKGPI